MPAGNAQAEPDHFEGVNRAVYGFNKGVDKVVVRPVTVVYRHVVPKVGRRGISNFFSNVDEPFSFVNAMLQGKPKQAMRTFARFTINTVLGIGGLFDHATKMGLPEEHEDFGQTLAVWGLNSGPYLMLPLLGPTTFRDAVGHGVELLGGDPYRHLPGVIGLSQTQRYAATSAELIDKRLELMDTADQLIEGSADEYATVRSAYLQQRLYEIHDGAPPEATALQTAPTTSAEAVELTAPANPIGTPDQAVAPAAPQDPAASDASIPQQPPQ